MNWMVDFSSVGTKIWSICRRRLITSVEWSSKRMANRGAAIIVGFTNVWIIYTVNYRAVLMLYTNNSARWSAGTVCGGGLLLICIPVGVRWRSIIHEVEPCNLSTARQWRTKTSGHTVRAVTPCSGTIGVLINGIADPVPPSARILLLLERVPAIPERWGEEKKTFLLWEYAAITNTIPYPFDICMM